MSGVIRDARPAEFATAGELTVQSYAPILAFGTDDPYLDELRDAQSRAANAQLLVFIGGSDQILGTLTVARPGSPYAQIAAPHELEVRMLGVSPAAHGQGIGTQLMAHVHDIAISEGFLSVALSVIGTNVRALQFYQGLGYRLESSRDWYPVADMPAPLKVLVKDLSAKA